MIVSLFSQQRGAMAMEPNEPRDDEQFLQLEACLAGAVAAVARLRMTREFVAESWIGAEEAASYAGVTENTIRKWVKQGLVRGGILSGQFRTKRSFIDAAFLHAASRCSGVGGRGAEPNTELEVAASIHPRVLEILGEGGDK